MPVRVARTGAKRDSRSGKGRYDLLPPLGIRAVAKRFEDGAEKYGERNWEKGQPLDWFVDSAMRHGFREMAGDTDEDHASAAAWNWLCYIETRDKLRAGLLPANLNGAPVAFTRTSAGSATGSSSGTPPAGTAFAGKPRRTAGRKTLRARRSSLA